MKNNKNKGTSNSDVNIKNLKNEEDESVRKYISSIDIMKIIMMNEKIFGSKIQEINNKNYIFRYRQKIRIKSKKHI